MTSARRGPKPAEERLRRLLVMLPWLMERGEVPVAEAAAHFGSTEAEIVRDLELAAMCGLPPFIDELIDVFIDEGMISVGVPRLFTRPLRLNSVEAWELLAAGRAALELPGADRDGPLARGLAKLADCLGDAGADVVTIDLDEPPLAVEIAAAIVGRSELRIEYWSPTNDETTERTIVPRQVFTDRGEWYVHADDDRSGSLRTFRLDRIGSLTATGRIVEPSDTALPQPGEWFEDDSLPRVRLRLAPAARWLVERYPVEAVTEPDGDGRIEVQLVVASEAWLTRALLRLGPDAEVVEPAVYRDAVVAAASRILDRYRTR